MKVRVTKNVLKALFEEGRYRFLENGTIQRLEDKTFVKQLCKTSKYNWNISDRGNVQYNLFSDKYGVVTVTMHRILDYGMKNNLLVKLTDFYNNKL